jgi:hypothetical protein
MLAMLGGVGCGSRLPPGKVRVKGLVTFGGKAGAADSVGFEAKDGSDSGVTRAEADGRFEVILKPGEYHVVVQKLKGEIQMDSKGRVTFPESAIPKRYWTPVESGLSAVITPSGAPITIAIPETAE